MIIHKRSNDRFLAELTKYDMENYCLDFESIDIKNENTRKLVSDLLVSSNIDLNTVRPASKLCVDVLSKDKECVLILITLERKKYYKLTKNSKSSNRIACRIPNFDILSKFMKILSEMQNTLEIELYFNNGEFVAVSKKYTLDKNNLKRLFEEFGTVYECDELAFAQLKEYYSPVP